MKKHLSILNVISIASFVTLSFIGIYYFSQQNITQLQTQYYRSELAAVESPYAVRIAITKGEKDFVLVDVRSQQEYEKEHIIGAINIPAYKNPQTPSDNEVRRIYNSFKNIKEQYPDKEIIIYCYSSSCMLGAEIAKTLSDHSIFVKELGIGWNEWRYEWNTWNHLHEWKIIDVMDYVHSGVEPGEYKE